ncbi:MAG TPA: peptidoglycan DD-metalloendopeptidase family protein [Xanthobacteraceae bacterium]|nr:peptidoglycan DD-metalloendopeptidase family protein [Xanthobacteraceae bacterium]
MIPVIGLLALATPLGPLAFAQSASPPLRGSLSSPATEKESAGAPPRAAREQELESVRAEQKKAVESTAKLKAEIEAIGEDRRTLQQALITTASRLRNVEERMTGTEIRLKALESNESNVRKSLASRRTVIAEILGALQRIGRRPPPALMVTPDDALQSVRTAMLLGAVLPEMRHDAELLAADLAELSRVRKESTIERDNLTRDLASLSQERQRMTLLTDERQKKQAETEKALQAEQQRAIALSRQADNLKELIAKLEQEIPSAARASADAKASGDAAAIKDTGRLAPAIAFASAKGVLPMPVNGVKIRDFGSSDGLGGTEKGLWVASRAAAQVTAPCDGWVVYAGPFRSYGQLLILNAGGGYHVLLAGMERISVDLGQFVVTGEPVAVMGGGPQSAAAVAIGSSQPVLYVEFRKDGTPIDPSPWWATNDSEKVRG